MEYESMLLHGGSSTQINSLRKTYCVVTLNTALRAG